MENINDNTCSICGDEITTEISRTRWGVRAFFRIIRKKEVLITLPCGHKHHYACLKKWADINPRCPLDRRLITNTPSCSANLREELLRSVKGGQIDNVRQILSAGFNPAQRSFLHRKNPLSVSLKDKQWEISAELIRAGAITRNKKAQHHLGWMHQKGLGVEQNYAEALIWYRKAADKGFGAAQNQLGWMHQNGLGVKQNYAEALTWYRKAADNGHASGQSNLGWMHQNGLGVDQNYAEALIWYRKASDQGYAFAQNQLGWMYENGLGVEQNYAEAFNWYLKAADKGHVVAQNHLGRMYQNVLGVE